MPLALLLAALIQAPSADGTDIDELHRAYEQSCVQRDYGAFDDVCQQIGDEIAAYERSHRQLPGPPRASSRGGDAAPAPPQSPASPFAAPPSAQPTGAAAQPGPPGLP